MPMNKLAPLTPVTLALDMLGSVLIGLGLAKVFAAVDLIPAPWRFENYELIFIGAGAALMLPTVVAVLKHAATESSARRP